MIKDFFLKYDFKQFLLYIGIIVLIAHNSILTAKPVVEKYNSFLLNWTTLRFRFAAQAKSASEQENWLQIEARAVQQGLTEIRKDIFSYWEEEKYPYLLKPYFQPKKFSVRAAEKITRTTYTTHISYVKEGGGVKVELESRLSGLFVLPENLFLQENLQQEQKLQEVEEASGLIFLCPQTKKPRSIYQIQSKNGKVLFSFSDISYNSYQQHMMGHWFESANEPKLEQFVGSTPLRMTLHEQEAGVFVISENLWQENKEKIQKALSAVKIVLILAS